MRRFLLGAVCALVGAAIALGAYAALRQQPNTTTCRRVATGRIEVPSGDPEYETVCTR